MRKLTRILMVLVVLAIVAGGGLLATWDIPAPTTAVEQTIDNSRFPR